MRTRLNKLLAAVMAVSLMCALLPLGAATTTYEPKTVVSTVSVSRMEPFYNADRQMDVVGVAFRYSISATGITYGSGRSAVLDNAKVDPTGAGTKYPLVRMGAVFTNNATIGMDETMLVIGNSGVTDISANYLFTVSKNRAEYAARIINVPLKHVNTLIYARPYYVYEANGEEVVVYGDIKSANCSGKKVRYTVETATPNWQSGALDGQNGAEIASSAAIRSDYINNTDLLIRLPEDSTGAVTAVAQVYYYNADGFISATDVTANWTVLKDLPYASSATAVRIVVRYADGADITDIGSLADSVTLTASRTVGSVPLTFHTDGLSAEDGTEIEDTAYNCTGYLDVQDLLVKPEDGSRFAAFFYDADGRFIECSSFYMAKAKKLLKLAPMDAAYVRFAVQIPAEDGADATSGVPAGVGLLHAYIPGCEQYEDFAAEANETELAPGTEEPEKPIEPDEPEKPDEPDEPDQPDEPLVLTEDVPENQGVQNALWNMQQMTAITYTPKKAIPQNISDYPANVTQKGIPYSSTRIDQLYVPNNVSFHTFMTALQNPNSYLYTVDLSDYGNINGKTYYGSVCSTACGYALGIIPNYTTYQWTQIPGMELLKNQDVQDLKLCDTIVGQGHVAMITGIVRDQYGNIVRVTVSEAAGSDVHSGEYTITALEERFPAESYEYCRYTKLAGVTYTASEYVAVGNETAQTVTYNVNIVPRKGDQANWRTDETVILDVIKQGTYTHIELYKDGKLIETIPITSVVKLTGSAYRGAGKYKARLVKKGSDSHSKWCQWIVTDAASVGELYEGTRKVKVSFSATNAEPLYIQWMNGQTNATIRITELTDAQKKAGYGIFVPVKGNVKVRVAFQTSYGIVYSELPDIITVS